MKPSRITRVWHGRTHVQHANAYLQYLVETGVPDYKKTPGILACRVLRRIEGDVCHFWTVTEWDNMDAIQVFAGANPEKAKYYPEDRQYLLELESTVQHCDTFEF